MSRNNNPKQNRAYFDQQRRIINDGFMDARGGCGECSSDEEIEIEQGKAIGGRKKRGGNVWLDFLADFRAERGHKYSGKQLVKEAGIAYRRIHGTKGHKKHGKALKKMDDEGGVIGGKHRYIDDEGGVIGGKHKRMQIEHEFENQYKINQEIRKERSGKPIREQPQNFRIDKLKDDKIESQTKMLKQLRKKDSRLDLLPRLFKEDQQTTREQYLYDNMMNPWGL